MSAIGGYFGLDLARWQRRHLYPNAVRLHCGRNALEYVLRARGYRRLCVPDYVCGSVLEPCRRLGVAVSPYAIDITLAPTVLPSLDDPDAAVLYVNYFGLKDGTVASLASSVPNLIVDNSQALFSAPAPGCDCFYSPRKFVGVPDGAYLVTAARLPVRLARAVSYTRGTHLLKRIDCGAEAGYPDFLEAERGLAGTAILGMSALSEALLGAINYRAVARRRQRNFAYLDAELGSCNELVLPRERTTVPLAYPFLVPAGHDLRSYLRGRRIYTPVFWPDVAVSAAPGSVAALLAGDLVCLPVDQRYDARHMRSICLAVQAWLAGRYGSCPGPALHALSRPTVRDAERGGPGG